MLGRVIFCKTGLSGYWALEKHSGCELVSWGQRLKKLHAVLTLPGRSGSPGPPGLVTATGVPQSQESPTGEEKGGEKRGSAPTPPQRALPAPRTHTVKDRRFPPFATGCELQVKVPVLLGGEPAAQAAEGARGWEKGEQRSAASFPSPDDPRPQKSKRAEEKLQLLFPPPLFSRSLSFFF